MEYGINLATASDSWKVVKRAEELGYTHAWFYDTQLLNADVFVAMAAAAMKTSKIRLGTGVLIPPNRIAPVTANALASLNALAPGRIDFGVSTGFTARRTMGLGAIRQDDMRGYIETVRGLLAGDTVEWDYEGASRKIRFLNPELELVNLTDRIPLHVSAFGPKGRRLTADLGAGWIIPIRDPALAIAALEDMQDAWRAAGRDPADLYATAMGSGCVLAADEPYDSARARGQAGPAASMVLHDLAEASERGSLGMRVPDALKPVLDAYLEIYRSYEPEDARYLRNHRGHLMFVKEEEAHLLNAGMIRALSFTATAPELREGVRAMRDAGYSQFSAHIRNGHPEMVEEWAELLAGV